MSRFRDPSPKKMIETNSVICARKPVKPSSAPIATAVVGSTPLRWKKRMLTATRPAVDGMARLTNVIANCSAVRRPSGTGVGEMPDNATAFDTRPIDETRNATIRIGRLASLIAEMMVDHPISVIPVTSIHPATNSSAAVNSPPSVTRRRRCRSRGSAPAASTTAARSPSMSTSAALALRRSTVTAPPAARTTRRRRDVPGPAPRAPPPRHVRRRRRWRW